MNAAQLKVPVPDDKIKSKVQLRREAKQRLLNPQRLTDRRFMTRPQREAFDRGEEIWV